MKDVSNSRDRKRRKEWGREVAKALEAVEKLQVGWGLRLFYRGNKRRRRRRSLSRGLREKAGREHVIKDKKMSPMVTKEHFCAAALLLTKEDGT
ncbi:hypothetical protein BHE74_00003052 [Ensete ventricosum]|nr:hypothetical protein BHE74_00003052 [Ensete ventricosum]RZS20481.1 hypothetical protein BHM03_00053009 [Ensete ventricosum]